MDKISYNYLGINMSEDTVYQIVFNYYTDPATNRILRQVCKKFRDMVPFLHFNHDLVKKAEKLGCASREIKEMKSSYGIYVKLIGELNITNNLSKFAQKYDCHEDDEKLFRDDDWKQKMKSYLIKLSEIPYPFNYEGDKIDIILDLIEAYIDPLVPTFYHTLELFKVIFEKGGDWMYSTYVEDCWDKTIHPILRKWRN